VGLLCIEDSVHVYLSLSLLRPSSLNAPKRSGIPVGCVEVSLDDLVSVWDASHVIAPDCAVRYRLQCPTS